MYDFKPDPALNTAERYRQLCNAVDALTSDEPDCVANMANVAALIWEFIPDLNWSGFYRVGASKSGDKELVLGPFVGRPACIRIPLDKGVCGAAVSTGETQLVEDVHAFPGHIACDAASRSELVVPVLRDGAVVAVIDLDSPNPERFTSEDAAGLEKLALLLSDRV
ncbi:GAF domain-containing protein [Erythrobacter crassostreae]|uniref:GAF domain-containing protein n=1 Tax=Erythrobacter crassostreae TaxID=2828328 RepID=A0A9X1JNM2_9SPHN|nr:GAF domain-containing protein [Erythrobacter crassostrea]MBV7258562.1 GAF domain-containing protein [Erythrobacter crassostrea]